MDTDAAPPSLEFDAVHHAVQDAVTVACLAPSIFNSQPWRWDIDHRDMLLYADHSKQVTAIDPEARLLTLSCGASLHHAHTELAAVGYLVHVDRLPDPSNPELLARLHVYGVGDPNTVAATQARSSWGRHTDRRPFAAGSTVADSDLAELLRAAHVDRVVVHDVTAQSGFLATAASAAAMIEARSGAYRAALADWVGRADATGEGIPLSTVVAPTSRPVALRDFAIGGPGGRLDAATGDDSGASYLVIATAADTPTDWLAAGEATSALLLTAAHLRLATSPMSDVVEVAGARALIRSLLPDHAIPQLVVRVGICAADTAAPTSPRR